MERDCIELMSSLMGYNVKTSDGIFCPGGSFANIMATLIARDYTHKGEIIGDLSQSNLSLNKLNYRLHGFNALNKANDKPKRTIPVILASKQSHYSVKRAAYVCGIGMNNIKWINSSITGEMDDVHLETVIQDLLFKPENEAYYPMMIHSTAGTTVTGGFDNFTSLATIASKYNIHLHVDAAWGGSVCVNKVYKEKLLKNIHLADTITWNPHKLLGIPLQCSVLLTKSKNALQYTNALQAEYLFHKHDHSQYDLGDKTLQCGRKSDALKLWANFQFYKMNNFSTRIDLAFNHAQYMIELIKQKEEQFQLAFEHKTTLNVCFYIKEDQLGQSTAKIYHLMQQRGHMLVNFNPLPDHNLPPFFRLIFNSPNITKQHCHFILNEILECYQLITKKK